jgi:cupin fold WbuC family metalloprotein
MTIFEEFVRTSDEAFHAKEHPVHINKNQVNKLINLASIDLKRKRVRYCIHKEASDPLHEMIIIHGSGEYIRPHMHLDKEETLLILSGEAEYFLFDDAGNIQKKMAMGDFNSGKPFVIHIPALVYHTLLIKSEWLVFCEIASGPFVAENCKYAPWAPEEGSVFGTNYLEFLLNSAS